LKLESVLENQLDNKLEEIASTIYNFDYVSFEATGILSGLAGIVPFLFDYSQYSKNTSYADLGEKYIYEIFTKLEREHSSLVFSKGLAGIGYVLEQLHQKGFIEKVDILDQHIPLFVHDVQMKLKNKYFDALHGAIGTGFYLLKKIENRDALSGVKALIKYFKENAIETTDGIYWPNGNNNYPGSQMNFGLAHGLPSVLVFLSLCIEAGIEKDTCTELLKRNAEFILSTKNPSPYSKDNLSLFKDSADRKDYSSRLAWCYGDLGVALAFHKVNKTVGGFRWVVNELLERSVQRTSVKETSAYDGGFCHGTAGILHIYKLFHNAGFKEISPTNIEYWLSKTLKFGTHYDKPNNAGYYCYNGNTDEEYSAKIGLLMGVTGIGHTLLSLKNGDYSWSEGLMIFE
jgi:lantibiotic modifying enzyme